MIEDNPEILYWRYLYKLGIDCFRTLTNVPPCHILKKIMCHCIRMYTLIYVNGDCSFIPGHLDSNNHKKTILITPVVGQ